MSKNVLDITGTKLDGGKVAVGTTTVLVTFTISTNQVMITADSANTGILYFGGPSITTAGANAMGFLGAGDSVILPYDASNSTLYVIASVVSQNFWKGGIL